MGRRTELNLADWPQPCLGNCGRLLRPPKTTAADYPGQVTACSQRVLEPWCQQCRARAKGKDLSHNKGPLTPAEEEARLERIRGDLRVMVADRRRRGIPPEGIVLPGDDKMHLRLQRLMPGEKAAPEPRTLPLSATADAEAPLGLCRRGHAFDGHDTSGRRTCSTCAELRLEANAERRQGRRGKDTCRRGHPFTSESKDGKRKYCPKCKKMNRMRNQGYKAAREARSDAA